MNEERNKFLTEVMGGCWHETMSTYSYHDFKTKHICACGEFAIAGGNWDKKVEWKRKQFTTAEDFVELYEWSYQQPWWDDFLESFLNNHVSESFGDRLYDLIQVDRFPNHIYEYLKSKRI